MPEMTLQEALQTDQVKGLLGNLVQEAVDEALDGDTLKTTVETAVQAAVTGLNLGDMIKTALEPQVNTIRESVQTEVAADRAANELRTLHLEATRLIDAAPLKGAAKTNLLEDYGLTESDSDEAPKPGRALALIEAEKDGEGKVTKTAKAVLRETVEADVKRARNVLREAAPTLPFAPGGGGGDSPVAAPAGKPDWVQRLESQGLDPKNYGYEPAKAAA
jgi:hypothetical protein